MSKTTCSENLSPPVTAELLGGSGKFIHRSNGALSTLTPNVVAKSKPKFFLFPQRTWVCNTPPTTSLRLKLLAPSMSVHTPPCAIEPLSIFQTEDVNSMAEPPPDEHLSTLKSRIDFPKTGSTGNRNFRIIESTDGEFIWLKASESADSEKGNHDHLATNEELSLPETSRRHGIDTRRLLPGRINFLREPGIPQHSLDNIRRLSPNESGRDCSALSHSKWLNKGFDYHSLANKNRLKKSVYNIGVVGSNGMQLPWALLNPQELGNRR